MQPGTLGCSSITKKISSFRQSRVASIWSEKYFWSLHQTRVAFFFNDKKRNGFLLPFWNDLERTSASKFQRQSQIFWQNLVDLYLSKFYQELAVSGLDRRKNQKIRRSIGRPNIVKKLRCRKSSKLLPEIICNACLIFFTINKKRQSRVESAGPQAVRKKRKFGTSNSSESSIPRLKSRYRD